MESNTITVNGTVYDAVTGMPVGKAAIVPSKSRGIKPSHHMHKRTESSHTVNRRASQDSVPVIQKRSDIQRPLQPSGVKSASVTRFAPQPSKAMHRPRTMNDIRPATAHPIVKKVEARIQEADQERMAAAIKPSIVIKQEAISEALDKAPHHSAAKPLKHKRRSPRLLSFASAALSLLLLAGYLTYINLPNLSVRVAANQAGINANYPGYRPDGYRLAGVNYDTGSVSLKFAANAGPQNFTLTQQQTSWDSTAVRENYVKTNWGDDVVPYSERGLTIYAHQGNAAWVNGGILYTITGDAPLSASQVRSIATSL